jgi:ribosome-binding factor A
MPGQGDRAAKMADRIREIVAKRIERGLRDPRLGFVTITDVRMTGDLQHASIFYTVYGTDEERAETAAALKSATGMLRTEVGKNLTARLTPSIEFIADGIPENAALISSLLDEAHARDAEVEALKKKNGKKAPEAKASAPPPPPDEPPQPTVEREPGEEG